MIPKLSSHDLNELFENGNNHLKDINKKIESIKSDLNTKLQIMKYENEYQNYLLRKVQEGAFVYENGMNTFYNAENQRFERYGNIVHAELIKEPINVFNLNMSGLGEKFFREDVSVYIDDKTTNTYTSILKDESIENKEIFFELRNTRTFTLSVRLNDTTCILGSTRCNCIEIDPFLPGSFMIRQIRIYGFNEDGEANNEVLKTYDNIFDVSKTRFILDKKYNFYRIDFDIELEFLTERNGSLVYPFGIKHLFFYNMDFKTDSFVIAKITTKNNISYIKDKITTVDCYKANSEKSITTEKIELYLEYDNGHLSYQIEPALPNDIVEIPLDIKTIYAKVPLNTINCYKGIVFEPVQRNE